MSNHLSVSKNRTTIVSFGFGFDLSADTLTSEIRTQANSSAPLIGAWDITPLTDGSDGEFIFTFPQALVDTVTATKGYMDVKRTSAGVSLKLIEPYILVRFEDVITE